MDDKKHDFGGQYCQIEVAMLYRQHPLVADLTDRQLLEYFRLWAMAVEFRRTQLPEPYTATPAGYGHIAEHIKGDRRVVKRMIQLAVRKRNRKALLKVDAKGRITVCGVSIKHRRLQFKDATKSSPQRDAFGQFAVGNKAKQSKTKQSKVKWAPGEFVCSDDLKIIEIAINRIKARNYDRVRIDATYENMFRIAAKIFVQQGERNGVVRCAAEIDKLSGWLEGKFDIGALQRDARHNPRQRITNWMRNAIKPPAVRDRDHVYDAPADISRGGDPVDLGAVLNTAADKAKEAKPKGD